MTVRSLYHSIDQFHENPRLIEYTTTPPGNLLLWLAVQGLLLFTHYQFLVPLMILVQLLPRWRMWIMTLSLGGWFVFNKLTQLDPIVPFWYFFNILIIIGSLYLFYRLSLSFASLPRTVRTHPQLFLHALLWFCILILSLLPASYIDSPEWPIANNLTTCVIFFAFLIWRIGFMIYSGKRGSIKQTGFVDHLVYCLPFLGYSQVPYGKGLDYLLPKMAKERLELAKVQLAGVKLLVLATLWDLFLELLDVAVIGPQQTAPWHLGLHHIDELIAMSATAMPSFGIVWGSLFVDMVYETTQVAITGHLIIGCLRLFGFNVFRNTYKPLLSQTLVDFWNRYYYYFKELLVDFFFFPTYLSFFKGHPRLRIFTATMASAFLGNFYYHFLQHFDLLLIKGTLPPVTKFSSYLFYCFVLAIGIFVSILREQNQRGRPHPVRAPWLAALVLVRRIAGVWLFFAILRIWDHTNSSFLPDTRFFFALFGIHG
ncbi:MAG: hypothetical protein HQM03_08755 [Magnetococcales bacterium]|nr:hypothetical protein [Magnetococcales bacterium]